MEMKGTQHVWDKEEEEGVEVEEAVVQQLLVEVEGVHRILLRLVNLQLEAEVEEL